MKVRALQTVTLGPGTVLELSKRQAARRGHSLLPESGGRWRTTLPVQFKAGEEFGVDAALPKSLAAIVETDAVAVARRKPAARAAPAPAPVLVDPAQLDIE